MLKFIQLKLVKIKYKGESIGDDIRVEIEALGKFLRVDKTIKFGTTSEINKEVGNFETEEKIFKINTKITVIEKDFLFSDVSNIEKQIKVDVANEKPQQFSCKIEIKETRSILGIIWGKKTAIFEVTLEAKVFDSFLYVSLKSTKNGWIQARKEIDKKSIDLPAFLKIRLEKQDNKFQYFTIWEGENKGIKAYMKFQEDGTSFFEPTNHHTGPVYLIYSLSQKTLKFKNNIYKLKEYKNDPHPWKKTLYDVKIADFYHGFGRYYLPISNLATVWFKTTHPDDARYVHPGSNSFGCVTLTEIERWDELCKILLKARKDDYNIGILEVID